MKRLSFRVWRENRRIEQAMRTAPPPKAPEWLKDRLIEQAKAAEASAVLRPTRPKLRLVWLAPAAVLVLVACWAAWHRPMPENGPKLIVHHAPSMERPEYHVAEAAQKMSRNQMPQLKQQPKLALHMRHPRLRRARRRHELPQVAQLPPTQPQTLRVSVTRETKPTVGYARVAAYTKDDSGYEVKTAWVLVDNPNSGTSHQEMSIDDTSGQRQMLKVSVVVPSLNHKGEEL